MRWNDCDSLYRRKPITSAEVFIACLGICAGLGAIVYGVLNIAGVGQ